MLVAMRSSEERNSLKVRKPRTMMSRMMSRDQRSPSISTEALSGHPERRLGAGSFPAILAAYNFCLHCASEVDKTDGGGERITAIRRKSGYFHRRRVIECGSNRSGSKEPASRPATTSGGE